MIGDAEGVRTLAREMTQLAAQARKVASELRAADGVDFVSDAAERYRRELRAEADSAEHAAREIDDAARALLKHASAVDSHVAALASAANAVKNVVEDIL